jgi:DNA invertase Pin-like site-specific DNA recombinase
MSKYSAIRKLELLGQKVETDEQEYRKLKEQERKAVANALLQGASLAEVEAASSLSRSTIYRIRLELMA